MLYGVLQVLSMSLWVSFTRSSFLPPLKKEMNLHSFKDEVTVNLPIGVNDCVNVCPLCPMMK